ncbi:MAG: type II toxin-antitoxin system prevent-host-death family antitoxin [Candidatus Berkelbacteria bacterium]|nr:type II toxin-antitoxin system prevent-host-death family antitoxin [Candidatus Berkelbacteria bacterium]
MTDKIIGVKELRENIDKYAAQVKAGRSITVVKRSEPLFRLTPVDDDDDANWETMIDFRKFPGYENGIPVDDLITRIEKINADEDKELLTKGKGRGQSRQIAKKIQSH